MNFRVVCCLAALLSAGPALSQSLPQGRLALPEFAGLEAKANESVSVTLDANLLGLAAQFLDSADPAEANAKKLVSSLSGIYVRSYNFDSGFEYPKAEIDSLRRQLTRPGWSRMVETRSKKENTEVDVFLLIEKGKARGLAIIASEPRQFTIVNIVGQIDLAQLHELEGKFGVPALNLETGKAAKLPAK